MTLSQTELRHITRPSLQHHGVKGMKWGHRQQQKWERKSLKKAQDNYINAHNASSGHMNAFIEKFNSDWDKKKVHDPDNSKYEEAFFKKYEPEYNKTVESILNSRPDNISPTGQHKVHYKVNGFMNYSAEIRPHNQHTHHSVDYSNYDLVIQHHGVKGMHWGKHVKSGAKAVGSVPKKVRAVYEGAEDKLANRSVRKMQKEYGKRATKIKDQKAKKISKLKTKGASTEKISKVRNKYNKKITGEYLYSHNRQVDRIAKAKFNQINRRTKYSGPEKREILRSAISRAAVDIAVSSLSKGAIKSDLVSNTGQNVMKRKKREMQNKAYKQAKQNELIKNFRR